MRYLAIAICLLITADASATPDSGTWRRQTLLGENADHFFRYVTVMAGKDSADDPEALFDVQRNNG